MDSSTVGNGLVRVDALLELLAIEEVTEELLDLWNTGGTTDKDDLVNLVLGDVGILEDLLDWLESTGESLGVQVLETSTSDLGVEILTIEEGVDLDGGLGSVGKSSLGTLASGSETSEGTWVVGDV